MTLSGVSKKQMRAWISAVFEFRVFLLFWMSGNVRRLLIKKYGKIYELSQLGKKKSTHPVIFDGALKLIIKHQHQQILGFLLKKEKKTCFAFSKGQVKQDSLLH